MDRSKFLVLPLFLLSIGCADRTNYSPIPSISQDAKAGLDKPVNCKTAERDIEILENEKASVGKRMLSGVRSVFPFAAAAGILTGDYSDRVQVATGQYNDDLEAKISQIIKKCSPR